MAFMMERIESSALNHKGLQIITVIIINKNVIYESFKVSTELVQFSGRRSEGL